MAIRLIVGINAAPGKGSELAKLYKARCAEISREPGCEQFEVFQSVVNPDKLAILERWTDQAALDVHAKANATRAPCLLNYESEQQSAKITFTIALANSPEPALLSFIQFIPV